MSGAKIYGATLGVLAGSLTTMADPVGPTLFYGLLSAHTGLAAAIVWRRMRYPHLAVALALAAMASATIAGLCARGWRFPFAPLGWNLVIVAVFIGAFACYRKEARRRGSEWRSWREAIKSCSALDILLLRHIPQLKRPDRRALI